MPFARRHVDADELPTPQEQRHNLIRSVTPGPRDATDDPESPEQPHADPVIPTPDQIDAALSRFVGVITQRPPAFSTADGGVRDVIDGGRAGKNRSCAQHSTRLDKASFIEATVTTDQNIILDDHRPDRQQRPAAW